MGRDDVDIRKQRSTRPWWLKAVAFSFSATAVLGLILGLTGYPTEEWPFVAGVVGILLFLSALLVSAALLVAAKLLRTYRRAVFVDSGLDIEVEETKVTARVGIVLTVRLVITVLYASTAWGVALLVALVVLGSLGLPSFASGVHVTAVTLAGTGGGGLASVVGLSFLGYFLIGRMAKGTQTAPWVVRLVLNLVQGFERRAQVGSLDTSSMHLRTG
ncbi:MAG: hypothetical protein OXL37_16775 [Chloroflexota bacterium]|nr:hypothetical protein [Chloroflexota bacterium]MDE2960241.1 hypothetical protein [Chloroflexota bacterium]